MARKYELKRRAERQAETRVRIVEAAVELHSTIGPARTTLSAIAERAGVQRHTLYAHFPHERDLHFACSGLYLERNPLPDPAQLRQVAAGDERLRHGLTALYAYYAANEPMLANVTRDVEVHDYSREVTEVRIVPVLARMRDVLAEGLGGHGRRRRRVLAGLELALDFRTWQTLTHRGGLSQADAVETAVRAIRCQ